jgi:hypothetical protein
MPLVVRAVLVRVPPVRVVTPIVAPRRTPTRVLAVEPGIAALVGPRTAVAVLVERLVLVVMPTVGLAVLGPAELVVVPTVVRVVPGPAGPVAQVLARRTGARLETRPVVLVLEPPGRVMRRVTPRAVPAVPEAQVPVVLVRARPRPVERLRAEQDPLAAPRTAVRVAQRLVVTAVPAEPARVVPVPRVRAVLPMAAPALRAVLGRAVPAVPVTPGPVVQPRPVPVVQVVALLAAMPIPPAVT